MYFKLCCSLHSFKGIINPIFNLFICMLYQIQTTFSSVEHKSKCFACVLMLLFSLHWVLLGCFSSALIRAFPVCFRCIVKSSEHPAKHLLLCSTEEYHTALERMWVHNITYVFRCTFSLNFMISKHYWKR